MPYYISLTSPEVLYSIGSVAVVFGILQYFGVFRLFTYGNASLALLIGLPLFVVVRYFLGWFDMENLDPSSFIPVPFLNDIIFSPWFMREERNFIRGWTTPEYLLVFMGVAFLAIMFFAFKDPANPLVGNYNPNYSY